MTDPATVAKTYMHAWVGKDFSTLRGLLADDVTFSGPFAQLDNADDCLDGLRQLAEIVTDIVVHEQLADETDVITWFDLRTTVRTAGSHRELEPRGRRQDHQHPGHVRSAAAAAAG